MPPKTQGIDSRTVVVTGCSSGIGRCLALGLHTRGYRVIAAARREEDLDALRALGLHAVALELADPASIEAAATEVLAVATPYALINNAAYGQPGAVEDLTRETLRAQFETNVFGTQDLTNRLLPAMRRRGEGRIINISSVLGLVVLPYRGAYNASKFALEALSDTLRLELAGSGIQVALVEPGPIRSRFRANAHRAFRAHIQTRGSAHQAAYLGLERRLSREGPGSRFTRPPEAVLTRVIHALEHPRPRIRYYVTFPTYLFAYLRHLFSYRTLDRLLIRVGAAENR